MNPIKCLQTALLPLIFFGTASAASPSQAEPSFSDQDIMIRLASASFKTASSAAPLKLTVNVPDNWNIDANAENILFKVPYHAGVFGKFEFLSTSSSTEQDISYLQNYLSTVLTKDESCSSPSSALNGTCSILSGHIAGQPCKIYLFSGSLLSQKSTKSIPVRFYALAPAHWFHVYSSFFSNMLAGLQNAQ